MTSVSPVCIGMSECEIPVTCPLALSSLGQSTHCTKVHTIAQLALYVSAVAGIDNISQSALPGLEGRTHRDGELGDRGA